MGEIVNLRGRRRQRDRAAEAERAAANRARFGRGGAEKRREQMERAQAARTLDGARLDSPDPDLGTDGDAAPPTAG